MAGEPIKVFNNGDMRRDFTYIDDIVSGIMGAMKRAPEYAIYNLGNSSPEQLRTLISLIEKELGKEAEKIMLPMQAGDVKETYADVSVSEKELGYKPTTSLAEGIHKTLQWYRSYYGDGGAEKDGSIRKI